MISRMIAMCAVIAGMTLTNSAFTGIAEGKPVARLTVDAGVTNRIDTPVTAELPPGISASDMRLVEVKDRNRIPVPCQAAKEGNTGRICWILSGTTATGAKRVYELEEGKPVEVKGIEINDKDSALEIMCGDKPVLRYKYGIEPPPGNKSKLYARSGFIHPVWSPAGQVLTEIHPEDHIHHMGLWNAWTSVEFEKRHIDFWNIGDGKGTIRCAKVEGRNSGPVFGGFKVVQEYVDLTLTNEAKVALNEDLEVRVWNTGGAVKGYWLFDWISVQRCATTSPVNLNKYTYSGLGFRATSEWDASNSEYMTSEGKTRETANGTCARWGSMFGKTSRGDAGLLLMTDPRNWNYPEPLRIWKKNMGGGKIFFNFCPNQNKPLLMEPGKEYVFRYRGCAYDGTMSSENAERLWSDLGNPPSVTLENLSK